MMIGSQAPIHFWGEAVNTAVYFHQRSPNEGFKRNDHDGYRALFKTPYKMLDGFGKPTHDADSNKILYQASLHNLRRFGCYTSRFNSEVQCHQGKLGPRSKPCMMVGYTHDSKTLWRIWDPESQRVNAQSQVVFDEERNGHMLCQHGCNEINIFALPADEEYVEETDTGDEPVRDSQATQIGKRSKSHMHEPSDKDKENAQSRFLRQEDQTAQRLAANAEDAHIRHLRQEDHAAQRLAADAENIALSQRLRREDQSVWHLAAAIGNVSPAPPLASRVTKSQDTSSTEALMASEATGAPFTYAEAMERPQQTQWKEPWRKKAHQCCSLTLSPLSTPRKHATCKLRQLALSGFIRLKTILTGPHDTMHS